MAARNTRTIYVHSNKVSLADMPSTSMKVKVRVKVKVQEQRRNSYIPNGLERGRIATTIDFNTERERYAANQEKINHKQTCTSHT